MTIRIRPHDYADYRWSEFEEWADDEDIGETEEDYLQWWYCWKTAICKERDRLENQLTKLEQHIQRIKHSL